jgi:two-component system, chemotaxis family, protein-glutamate methylesterase/glutaminase
MLDISRVEAIVMGGSAGSFSALKSLLPALPAPLPVPVLIVVHVPPDRPSAIAEIFRHGSHAVKEAEDKEPIARQIYFAPPGYHLLVETDRTLALAVDEPVHFSRPSIDVLFESAADTWGAALLAVLLSGASEDGAAGLAAVRERGGVTVVQDPRSAEYALMPEAAIRRATPSAVLAPAQIADLLASIPAQPPNAAEASHHA